MPSRGLGIQWAVLIRSSPGSGYPGPNSVLEAARAFRPDLVWGEKQEFLRIETLAAVRELGARLVHFTPDPYFSVAWKRTPLMDKAIGGFDVLVYCKAYERKDYGALR
jgi:hypothetical protein